jgi:riboflavin kinase/FMN adenylyltransferase
MRIYAGSTAVDEAGRGCVLTMGNFDGLHLGHRALIDAVLARGRELGARAALYTFDPHPQRVLHPERAPAQLMTWEQLTCALEDCGLATVVREHFTREFAALSPEEFLRDVLARRLAPLEVFVGRDFHFGRGRSGSGELLSEIAPRHGIRVTVIGQVRIGGEDVSSTGIRMALARGEVEAANRALGRPYSVWGEVVGGDRRGRTLGFPTANLATANEILPAFGVYATSVRVFAGERPAGPQLPAVTNVGTRPTFEPGRVLAETHLLDFEGDLYGARLELAFHARIRAEQRFPGPDALRQQIAKDVALAREIHKSLSGPG